MESSFRRLGNCLIVSNMVGSLYDPFSAKSVVIPAGLLSSSWILVPFPLKTKWGGRQPSFEDTIVIHVTRSHVRWWFCLTTVSQPLNESDFCFEVSFLCNGIWSMPMTGMSIPTVLWKNTLTRRMFFNASRIRRSFTSTDSAYRFFGWRKDMLNSFIQPLIQQLLNFISDSQFMSLWSSSALALKRSRGKGPFNEQRTSTNHSNRACLSSDSRVFLPETNYSKTSITNWNILQFVHRPTSRNWKHRDHKYTMEILWNTHTDT